MDFSKLENENAFWLPELLLAEGFPLEEIENVYKRQVLERTCVGALTADTNSRSTETYYWLCCLRKLVNMVNLQALNDRFKTLA